MRSKLVVLVPVLIGLGCALMAGELRNGRIAGKPGHDAAKRAARRQSSRDRIARQAAACVNRDPTTAGMLRCAQVELLQRDLELEEVCDQITSLLESRFDEATRRRFQDSQKRWEKFRDAEFQWIDDTFRQLDGTLYLPIRISRKSDVIHQRTQSLQSFVRLLDGASLRHEAECPSSHDQN